MKHQTPLLTHMAVASAVLGLALTASAQSVTSTSYTGIEDASQIVAPSDTPYVVTAVNVGGASDDTENGIKFLADTADASGSTYQQSLIGTGYTALSANEEDSGGVSGAEFTQSTINLGPGSVTGDTFTGLTLNAAYTFEFFLSDNNNGRGTQFSYTLGGVTSEVDLVQNVGSVNAYQVEFNTGTSSTFGWGLNSTTDLHDAKLSGFALFSASIVPEPSAWAMLGLGTLGLGLARRRPACHA